MWDQKKNITEKLITRELTAVFVNSPQQVHMLRRHNPVPPLTSYLFNIRFNITLPFAPSLPSCLASYPQEVTNNFGSINVDLAH
jgi:hypothetical protein